MRARLLSALIALFLATRGLTLMVPGAAAHPATPAGLPKCSAGVSEGVAMPATPIASPGTDAGKPVTGDSRVLQTVADIPLPGDTSRFDYQSFDPITGRLYLAHMDAGQLLVFDTNSRQVIATVNDLPTVTGVLVVPELHRVFAAVAGNHQVAIIDTQTLAVIARLGKIGFPDGIAYAPQTGRVFVSDESGGGELVIDAMTNRIAATIDIGGDAGNTQYDAGSGCILVAVQSRNAIVVIDPTAAKVLESIDLDTGCKGPHGVLIDPANRLAFVACEDNALLLTLDLKTMRITAKIAVGEGPDVLAVDPGWRRLYVASESGGVSVFAERMDEGSLSLQPLGQITVPNAHSVAVDPRTHLVYLPLADIGGKPVLRIMESPREL
ncbi:MAG: YncE family protein [Thermomicrobiales bacterium]